MIGYFNVTNGNRTHTAKAPHKRLYLPLWLSVIRSLFFRDRLITNLVQNETPIASNGVTVQETLKAFGLEPFPLHDFIRQGIFTKDFIKHSHSGSSRCLNCIVC